LYCFLAFQLCFSKVLNRKIAQKCIHEEVIILFTSKKGQSLSMQTIIVAALALLVLAIVALIFISRINATNSQMTSCVKNGGTCLERDGFASCSDYTRQPDDRNLAKYYGKSASELDVPCLDTLGNVKSSQRCCIIV
jgi:hypothetical protein